MTDCTISYKHDNKIKTIYCHLDGYPDNAGIILCKYYTDPMRISVLLDMGNINALGMNLFPVPEPKKMQKWWEKLLGINKPKDIGITFDPKTGKYVETSEPHSLNNPWVHTVVALEEPNSEFFEPAEITIGDEPSIQAQHNYMFNDGVWLIKNDTTDGFVNLRDYLYEDFKARMPEWLHDKFQL